MYGKQQNAKTLSPNAYARTADDANRKMPAASQIRARIRSYARTHYRPSNFRIEPSRISRISPSPEKADPCCKYYLREVISM